MLFAMSREPDAADVVWVVTMHLMWASILAAVLFSSSWRRFHAGHILIALSIGGVFGMFFYMGMFLIICPEGLNLWPKLRTYYLLHGGYLSSVVAVCCGMGASWYSLEFLGPRFVRRDKPGTDADISDDASRLNR